MIVYVRSEASDPYRDRSRHASTRRDRARYKSRQPPILAALNKPTRTVNRLHFEHFDPRRFEDLLLALPLAHMGGHTSRRPHVIERQTDARRDTVRAGQGGCQVSNQ